MQTYYKQNKTKQKKQTKSSVSIDGHVAIRLGIDSSTLHISQVTNKCGVTIDVNIAMRPCKDSPAINCIVTNESTI